MGKMGGHPMPGVQLNDGTTIFDFPTQEEINEQDTPFLSACLALNNKMSIFGLPHGQGWISERNTVLQIREICKAEISKYENWAMKNQKNLDDR